MMQIVLCPVDVWLFRDSRPFTAGEDHAADTLFPPTPFTLQGALRTKVLLDKGEDLSAFVKKQTPDPDVGFGDNYGRLRLFGPLLARRVNASWQRLIPVPADVVRQGSQFRLLSPLELKDTPFLTNLPSPAKLVWTCTDQPFKSATGWLPEEEWRNYLNGSPPQTVVPSEELFTFEPRFGIAINPETQTTQTGLLYQARFVRLKEDVGLWAEVEGIPVQQKGTLRFGGEGRAAVYQAIDPLPWDYNLSIPKDGRFKVVLVTLAWFSEGWQPANGDWEKIFGARVRFVAAIIPRAQRVGGFDLAKNAPKPMRSFVPPGSVYFFEAEEDLPREFAFTETPEDIHCQGGNWAQLGLGKVLIGRWEPCLKKP